MKKVLLLIALVLVVLGIGGYAWYKVSYGGATYYVEVATNGKKTPVTADDGAKFTDYDYVLTGYDKAGQGRKLTFRADHNLRHGAYLAVTWNAKKGVVSWEELSRDKVPAKALTKLE